MENKTVIKALSKEIQARIDSGEQIDFAETMHLIGYTDYPSGLYHWTKDGLVQGPPQYEMVLFKDLPQYEYDEIFNFIGNTSSEW